MFWDVCINSHNDWNKDLKRVIAWLPWLFCEWVACVGLALLVKLAQSAHFKICRLCCAVLVQFCVTLRQHWNSSLDLHSEGWVCVQLFFGACQHQGQNCFWWAGCRYKMVWLNQWLSVCIWFTHTSNQRHLSVEIFVCVCLFLVCVCLLLETHTTRLPECMCLLGVCASCGSVGFFP